MKKIIIFLLSVLFACGIWVVRPISSEAAATTDVAIDDTRLIIEKAKIKNISASNKKLTVKIEEVPGVSGYQVQISTSKKFRSKYTRTTTVKGNTAKDRKVVLTKVKNKSKSVKLKNGTKYYIRIRAYNVVSNGDTIIKAYGEWSTVKTKKPKKYKKKVTVYYY